MRIRLVLGPAGSGKTFGCLAEIRRALFASPEGPPLLLIAPKQATYQLERKLLEDQSLAGYTRLFILSFERLAHFIFESTGQAPPRLIEEEGRVMILRSLLVRHRDKLKIFRASSKLTGFAQQLSVILRELHGQQVTPAALRSVAEKFSAGGGLERKLSDLATILELYGAWLERHDLKDSDCLLSAASELLRRTQSAVQPAAPTASPLETSAISARSPVAKSSSRGRKIKAIASDQLILKLNTEPEKTSGNGASHNDPDLPLIQLAGMWIDGFNELSPQEIDFTTALAPFCSETVMTFCLDEVPAKRRPWLSHWSAVGRSFEQCRMAFEAVAANVEINTLRDETAGRFRKNPALQHLEKYWDNPTAFTSAESLGGTAPATKPEPTPGAIRVIKCANPESEAVFAAREIMRHVREGGRFREAAVLVRNLETHHEPLQRVFARYEIPYFLDRRESVAHHPLAELTRSALRTVALQWQNEDWFAALKSGLAGSAENEIDELENEALARGWRGRTWLKPLKVKEQPRSVAERDRLVDLEKRMERLRLTLIGPFQDLGEALSVSGNQPNGGQMAAAIRELWQKLRVESTLDGWAQESTSQTGAASAAVHATVWTQMNGWLENLERAFAEESLTLRQWLPIIEAGLGELTVGIVPPALDQVLIGAINRSRNPEIRLALVLGMNESVFPARPESCVLLTEGDRAELERHNIVPPSTAQHQLGRERFYGYLACTRASERLLLTHCSTDADGDPLNPSPFIGHLQKLFPSLSVETFSEPTDWEATEHVSELIVPLLKIRQQPGGGGLDEKIQSLSRLDTLWRNIRELRQVPVQEKLAPKLAEQLYGPIFHTSVSRLEQFAACPFKFFVHSGLRAEERRVFELDLKERGTFQHEALALFHQHLRQNKKAWRDLTPPQARELMGQIAQSLVQTYREGLLQSSNEARFTGEILIESLKNFVAVLVSWMRQQYLFDPVKVELPFGQEDGSAPWVLDLPSGQRLALNGRIDRVDIWTDPKSGQSWCVVLDYKSSHKQLDPILLAHGIQLQLVAYLNVLRNWPDGAAFPEARNLIPAGVFYVNLRGRYGRSKNRVEALDNAEETLKLAYRHSGRFDSRALPLLDSRPNVTKGDQFNFRFNQDGTIHKGCREVLETSDMKALLDSIEEHLRRMGTEIFSGRAGVAPFQKGSLRACDQCVCQPVCRIDPWQQPFRVLRKPATADTAGDVE